jgi:hypothetical protein
MSGITGDITDRIKKATDAVIASGACPNCGAFDCDCRPSEKAMAASDKSGELRAAADLAVRKMWLKHPFLNATAVREFLLEHARKTRAKKFSRVSEDTLIAANEALRQWMISHVQRMPSKGKTL